MTDIYLGDKAGEGSEGLRSLGAVTIPNPDRVTSVAVVPVDVASRKVLSVYLGARGLDLPGGHRQHEDADLEATARRECLEEACVELGSLWLIDVVESEYYGATPDLLTYMVIYAGVVDRLLPFTESDESLRRELVSPEEFLKRYDAGDPQMMHRWIASALARFDYPAT